MTLFWRSLWSNLLVTAKTSIEKTKSTVRTKSSSTTNSGNSFSPVSSSGDDNLSISTSRSTDRKDDIRIVDYILGYRDSDLLYPYRVIQKKINAD